MKINVEEIKGFKGIVSEYEDDSPSHTLPQSLTASCLRQKQVLPTHSGGHLTPAFPDVFLGLMEHSWMHNAPLPISCRSWALQTVSQMEAGSFSWCTLHSPSARKDEPKESETPCDIWNNPPHADSYVGFHKINCIFPGTKLEMTQRAINAEICLCAAKLSDEKPIRQFLPYVLEWILPHPTPKTDPF